MTGESWRPVDLAAALDAGPIPPPVLLSRDDGAQLLYAGKTHTVSGEPESLKTWLVLLACAAVITGGGHVVFVDYEDDAQSIGARLVALGCRRSALLDRFHYIDPSEPFGDDAKNELGAAIAERPALAVIDGVTEAMTSHDLDPMSNADVARFGRRLPAWFVKVGAIVVMIDHVAKNRETRGRYAIGAQHKLSLVTGAAYTIERVKPFGRGLHGMAKIALAKDKAGHVRGRSPGDVVGMLHLQSEADGSVLAHIEPPKIAATPVDAESFRPTILMERISKYVEAHPGLSGRAIVDAVRGKVAHKRLALELLIAEGYVDFIRVGNAHQHKSGQPFRCGSDGDSTET